MILAAASGVFAPSSERGRDTSTPRPARGDEIREASPDEVIEDALRKEVKLVPEVAIRELVAEQLEVDRVIRRRPDIDELVAESVRDS